MELRGQRCCRRLVEMRVVKWQVLMDRKVRPRSSCHRVKSELGRRGGGSREGVADGVIWEVTHFGF